MERLYNKDCNLKEISPLAFSFIGDGIFDLLVREWIICSCPSKIGIMNNQKVEKVCCKAQSESMKKIINLLTEEEVNIYKRGRNAKVNHIPKNSDINDYHCATGFEALFGYLYMKGDIKRLRELFNFIVSD